MALVQDARDALQNGLIQQLLLARRQAGKPPTNADAKSVASSAIAEGMASAICTHLGQALAVGGLSDQAQGTVFAELVRAFLNALVDQVEPVPGGWTCKTGGEIDEFAQYAHLGEIETLVEATPALRIALGGNYIVKPDVVVFRMPPDDHALVPGLIAAGELLAAHTPFRASNGSAVPLIRASVSCKWTIRSDRAQNSRTEALNLIRNRKGRTPAIVVVTAEPLPSRIASLAYGTGDFDRIYHVALNELQQSCAAFALAKPGAGVGQQEHLIRMVAGKRLADISDLVYDLAV